MKYEYSNLDKKAFHGRHTNLVVIAIFDFNFCVACKA